MKIHITSCISVFFVSISGLATANNQSSSVDLTNRQKQIIQTVLTEYIDKELYEEFWSSFNVQATGESSVEFRKELTDFMTATILDIQEYQLALWRSAKRTLAAGHVVRLPEVDRLLNIIKAQNARYNINSTVEELRLRSYSFLNAVAQKEPAKAPDGSTYYVTNEVIDKVLSRIPNAISRFKRLFSSAWQSIRIEKIYKREKLKVLSGFYFVESVAHAETAENMPITIYQLDSTVNKTDAIDITVTYASSPITKEDEAGLLRETINSAAENANVTLDPIRIDLWHGHSSERVCWKGNSGGMANMCIRAVSNRRANAIYLFIAVSKTSELGAALLLNGLEQDIQLLN